MSGVNQNAPAAANRSGGENPTLDALYDTLGAVTAGMDLRGQEADEAKKRLLDQEKQLIEEREQAANDGDLDRSDELSRQLDELRVAWAVLTHDDEEQNGSGTDQQSGAQGDVGGGGGADGDEPADGADGPAVPGSVDSG